jgi:hypothetical protein
MKVELTGSGDGQNKGKRERAGIFKEEKRKRPIFSES